MSYILFGLSFGVMLVAVSQLLVTGKGPLQLCIATGFFSLGYILLYFWLVLTGFIEYVPILLNSDIAVTFIIAPAIHLSFISMIYGDEKPVRGYLRYFVPPAVIMTLFFTARGVGFISGAVTTVPGHFGSPTLFVFSLLSDIYMAFYIAWAIIRGFRFQSREKRGVLSGYRFYMTFLFLLLATSLLTLANYLIRSETLLVTASALFGIEALSYSLACVRVPFRSAAASGKPGGNVTGSGTRSSPENPQWERELTEIVETIRALVETKGCFRKPDFRLTDLAAATGRTRAQISYSINRGMGQNFKTYLNAIRLEHTTRELLRKTGEPILDIAFRNGFNSKSTFNTLFIARHGVSPSEFRKKNLPDGEYPKQ